MRGRETDDEEVKKQAVFALSQRRDGEAVPALIQVARNNRDPSVRRTALFWLGQTTDPRAVSLFEEILKSN
jgi:HEAT repeat protein